MHKFTKYLKNVLNTNIFYILAAFQSISVIGYLLFIKDLPKPGGLWEVLVFMFIKTDKYFLCLFLGIIALIINFILILSLFTRIPIIEELLEDYYDENIKISKIKFIVNLILGILLLILNIIFLKFLFSIIFILVIVVAVIIIFSK
ncbi:hypothetical protein Ccar_16605 [Clostridium carboxidivorans P7]|uniref:hypothetical protein n=1 Tax=Clostridium carboxidivorans TaxID=217159 RepID=UPI00064E4195|nr:hypothetical protein [Clostridium carboxidivorans]AKN32393.1 hypothetical protein Ccar_16605 [Clostridium carboxidivorans P7]